jgi:hypothetical protein
MMARSRLEPGLTSRFETAEVAYAYGEENAEKADGRGSIGRPSRSASSWPAA